MNFYNLEVGQYFKPRNCTPIFQKTGYGTAKVQHGDNDLTFIGTDFDDCQPCKMIAPSEIKFRKGEGRRTWSGFKDLIDSVSKIGVCQPIILSSDGYLIDGWYRFQAARAADLKLVPVIYTEKY